MKLLKYHKKLILSMKNDYNTIQLTKSEYRTLEETIIFQFCQLKHEIQIHLNHVNPVN